MATPIVFASQVLGHIPLSDLHAKALSEMRRVLKPRRILATRDAAESHAYPRGLNLDRLFLEKQMLVLQNKKSGDDSVVTLMPALYHKAGFDVKAGKACVGVVQVCYTARRIDSGWPGVWLGCYRKTRKVTASLAIADGIDESNVIVLDYPTPTTGAGKEGTGTKTAISSSTFKYRSAREFARIESSSGEVVILGLAGSVPTGYRIISGPQPGFEETDTRTERTYNVEKPEGTLGFFWEADAVAQDIANGRTENATMLLDESLRMMKVMDQIRFETGLLYPQDSE